MGGKEVKMWKNAFGYEKIESFFSFDEIDQIKGHVEMLIKDEDRKDYIWKYYEKDKKTLNRIEYFVNYNESLKNLSSNVNMMKLIEKKFNDKPVLFKDKINFKYPSGEGFSAHQDIAASWGKYSNKHITVAIPLCDTDEQNGCIFFGNKTKNKMTNDFEDLDENILLNPCPTKTGDIVLFDSYVPHASYKNNSDHPRTIMFFTYTPKQYGDFYEKYHADKFRNVPPDIYKIKGKKYRSGNSNSIQTFY